MRATHLILILTLILWESLAVGHGGEVHDNPAGAAQMAASSVDNGGGSASVEIAQSRISGSPSGSSQFQSGFSGSESSGSESSGSVSVSSGPVPLSAPTTVPNSTVRSVPNRPGAKPSGVNRNSPSKFTLRSPASQKIYEDAYNVDLEQANKLLKAFAR